MTHYPVWTDDARTAVDRLRDAVGLIVQPEGEPSAWPFKSWSSDLMSPAVWRLHIAGTQLSLARFYLGLATDQARRA